MHLPMIVGVETKQVVRVVVFDALIVMMYFEASRDVAAAGYHPNQLVNTNFESPIFVMQPDLRIVPVAVLRIPGASICTSPDLQWLTFAIQYQPFVLINFVFSLVEHLQDSLKRNPAANKTSLRHFKSQVGGRYL